MAASPENIFKPIVDVYRFAKERPAVFAARALIFVSAAATPLILPPLSAGLNSVLDSLGGTVANTQFGIDWNERAERQRHSVEAATQARQDVLRADFEQTDGVDKTRVADNSWLITITRPSSVLGGSPQEILGRVASRVASETGCKGLVVTEAYVDRTSRWFSTPSPTVYSVSAIGCPK